MSMSILHSDVLCPYKASPIILQRPPVVIAASSKRFGTLISCSVTCVPYREWPTWILFRFEVAGGNCAIYLLSYSICRHAFYGRKPMEQSQHGQNIET